MQKGFGVFIFLAILSLLIGATGSSAYELLMDKVTATINDMDGLRQRTVNGGDTLTVKPNASIQLTMRLKNTYPSSSETDYEDVYFLATIKDADNGDDIEEESNSFSVNAGETEEKSVVLRLPLMMNEDTFRTTLELTTYLNGTTQEKQRMAFDIEVAKADRQVVVTQFAYTPTALDCGSALTMQVGIVNLGNSKEDISIVVDQPNLGIYLNDSFRLDVDTNDDAQMQRTYPLRSVTGISSGNYDIPVRIYYNKGNDFIQRYANVLITCGSGRPSAAQNNANTPAMQVSVPPITVTTNISAETTIGNTTTVKPQQSLTGNVVYTQPGAATVVDKTRFTWPFSGIITVILVETAIIIIGVMVLLAVKQGRRRR